MRLTLQLTQLGIEVKCRTQSGNFSALQTDVLHYLADAMGQRVTVASMPAAERGMFKHYLADAMGQRVTVASMPAAERGMFKHPAHAVAFFHIVNTPDTIRTLNKTAAEFGFVVEVL